MGTVDVLNSTALALAGDAVFTGSWYNVLSYTLTTVSVKVDQNSATNGLRMQWSSDGINLDHERPASLTETGDAFNFMHIAKYFRIIYTNGNTDLSVLRLQTIHHKSGSRDSAVSVAVAESGASATSDYTAGTSTYTEGTSLVTAVGVVRNDALATLANTDNEITALQVNSSGAMYVTNSGYLSASNTSTVNVGGQTTINEGGEFGAADVTLTVADGSVFDNNTTIKIGSEYLQITGISTNDLTVTRGAFDSTAAAHTDGTTVVGVYLGTSELSNAPDVSASAKSSTAGTLYFDFSDDDTLWDTYPVTGFNVAANNHEYHTAVKNPRYFRVRFENGSVAKTTAFRLYTYFGDFKQGNLPLNQSISSDQDSIIVRSVGVGAAPLGTYINTPADGSAFNTSSVLTSTTLNGALLATDTTITATSTSGFSATGTFVINEEEITYTGISSNDFTGCTRGANGTTVFAHASGAPLSQAYESIWVNSDGWKSIEIFVASDVASKTRGVIVEFTNDTSVVLPTVRARLKLNYDTINVERGYHIYRLEPSLAGYRVRYLNGNTTQTSFYLETTLKTNGDNFSFNTGGALTTADFLTEVAFGNMGNYQIDTKFGRHTGLTSAQDPQDLFEGGSQNTANNTYAGQPLDYTPEAVNIVSSSTADNAILSTGVATFSATSSSSTLTVTDTSHGASQGNIVTFTGAVTLGGTITAAVINRQYVIATITNANVYTVTAKDTADVAVVANGSDTGNAGASCVASYAGSGALIVRIYGLLTNRSRDYVYEDIIMNGTTNVLSSNTWWRINRMSVISAGTGGHNAGAITAISATSTLEFCKIIATNGQTQLCAYTVPFGKKIIITTIIVNISRSNGSACSGVVKVLVRDNGTRSWRSIRIYDVTNSIVYTENINGIVLDALTDIKFRIQSVSEPSTQFVGGKFEFVTENI
jgi:hypothetical protein